MFDFVMPSLGADMETGMLVGWLKKPGDAVHRGDVIAEVETDKGIIEIEVFQDGVIHEILVQTGTKVPVGTVLARIREIGDAPAAAVPAGQSTLEEPSDVGRKSPLARKPEPLRSRVSPAARQLAQELNVNLDSLHGSGPGGVISREDVLKAASKVAEIAPAAAESATKGTESAIGRAQRMRQSIATAMARSKREIPHYYLSTTIDMQRALDWLADFNAACPVSERLLLPVLLLKATAVALRQFPELNAVWETDRVRLLEDIHMGVAIALRPGGLIAPALRHAGKLSLSEMMQRLRDLTDRARSGGLRGSELSDATITVTSLGDRGVEAVFGIIYPPQVALVGFGRIVERPWSINGKIESRHVVTATLSADHRVSDGHRGGLFLSAIDRLLQEPENL